MPIREAHQSRSATRFSVSDIGKRVFSITVVLCAVIVGIAAHPSQAHATSITDTIPGATSGFSLRQIKDSYTGPLVRIRTSSSIKADVYADTQGYVSSASPVTIVSGSSSATTLGSLVSGVDAFVEIWYDQVGGVADLKQLSTSIQPQIVTSGTLIATGTQSKATIVFDGVNDTLISSTSVTFSQPATLFVVATALTSQLSTARMFHVGGTSVNRFIYQVATGGGIYAGSFVTSTRITPPFSQKILSMSFNTTTSALWSNGVANGSGNAGTNSVSGNINLGTTPSSGTSYFSGTISEFIIYPSLLSTSDRQTVENNEMDYYTNGVSSPPTVIASAATNIATSTVTLNGNLTFLGSTSVTDKGFQYGLTTSYGSVSSTTGTFSTGAYTANLTGLTCNVLYHFRAFATNSIGTSYSSDQTFTTACESTALGVSRARHAYGLRTLVSGYSGFLVRIRRTDGAQADVSADASGSFSTTSPITIVSGGSGETALNAFITSTNAFVVTWYDQVQNTNLTQATNALQPQIVSSGAIITDGANVKPAIQFGTASSTTPLLSAATVSITQPFMASIVTSASAQASGTAQVMSIGTSTTAAYYQVGSSGGMYSGTLLTTTLLPVPYDLHTLSLMFSSSTSALYEDGALYASGDTGSQDPSGTIVIGSGSGNNYPYWGKISEVIIYAGTVSSTNRGVVEQNQISLYGNFPVLTITTPARAVVASSTTATVSYVDQRGNTVYVPFIQSSTTLAVAASGSTSALIPSGGGVKFILNEGLSGEQSLYDMSSPYATSFTNVPKGTYTLDAYVVDSSQIVVSGSHNHDRATNIGIGDIYLAVGDSITKGSNGSGCSADPITNWTQADKVSTDGRNYCQWEDTGTGAYTKSWMPELNNELESYFGYPVFIMNEGYSGYTSNGYNTNTMNTADWKARVNTMLPNKAVILLGTNDTGAPTSTTANITSIITKLIGTYHIASSSIYIGLPLYAGSRPTVQTYTGPLHDLAIALGVQQGANFSNFFQNHPELYSDTPAIHPNSTGYLSVARLWGLSLIKPTSLTASSTSTGVGLSWNGLSLYDAIPTGTAGITGYQLSYGTSPGTYTTVTDVGNVTAATVTGLSTGQTYYFAVVAHGLSTDQYFSATSTEASVTYNGAPASTAPTAPLSLVATRGNTQISLSWSAPSSNGGSAITSYNVYNTGGALATSTSGTTATITGLTNGTLYSYYVTAVNGVGESASSTPASATPATVPGIPTGAAATRGDSQVSISWTAPVSNGGSSITSYNIYNNSGTLASSTSGTSATITGLTNGTSYSYYVTAVNAIGESASSSVVSATPAAVPSIPLSLVATRGNAQISLSWSAPASNGGSSITSYNVYNTGGALATTTSGTTAVITGLTNGTLYSYYVTAVSAVGESASSTPASATPATSPGIPTAFTAIPGNAQISFTWTAPASTGGAAISSYNIYISGGAVATSTSGTSATITGLTNGTSYSYYITAVNTAGESASSSIITATPSTTPSIPLSLVATRGNGQITLTWSAPSSNGGSAITTYKVYNNGGGVASTTSGTSATITGLTNGTLYSYYVTAVNTAGESASSSPSSATPATVPGSPTGLGATRGDTQISLSWTAPASDGGSSVTSYNVYVSGGALATTTSGTTATITGLTNGVSYSYYVTAVNALGESASSSIASATPAAVPSMPLSLVATRGNAQISLSWSAPASSGGSAITAYNIYASGGALASTTSGTSAVISGLTNGTLYSYYVTAVSAAGESASSTPASATPATVPGAPTGVSASEGDSQATISWSAPASNGGSAITLYTVVSSPGTFSTTTTSTSALIAGLTNGVAYTFTVAATNAIGVGATSSASSAVTPTATAPNISSVASGSVTSTGAVITWTTDILATSAVDYGASTSYGAVTAVTDSPASATSHSVALTGLNACTTYFVRAKSSSASGATALSTSVSFTTAGCTSSAAVTDEDQANAATTGTTTITLATTASSGAALTVPASAISTTTTFQIKSLDQSTYFAGNPAPSGLTPATGQIYNFKAITGDNTVVSSFSSPITVTLTYTASDISGLAESSLTIERWNGSSWNALTGCSVDTALKQVSCTTTSFSDFGLFGTASASAPVTSTPTYYVGGGGGGGGGTPAPVTPVKPATSTAVAATTTIQNVQVTTPALAAPLRLGSFGTNVTILQTLLARAPSIYPEGLVTGYFGALTERAVGRFQVAYKITSEGSSGVTIGVVGPTTWQKIHQAYSAPAASAPLSPLPRSSQLTIALYLGLTDPQVAIAQRALNMDPFTAVSRSGAGSPGHETGYFGLLTKVAVQKFQAKYDIAGPGNPAYGTIGPATRKKMNEILGS
ncbi:MAG: fibronectin type protein [Candidatus Parcubacteria bacterium]|nr:fibronectin type protein [Candidatus Parcubacteria bacterium]